MDKRSQEGFTLIEVLAVFVILGILIAIAVPVYLNSIEKAETEVCNTNRNEVERMYNMYLVLEEKNHTNAVFFQYLKEFPGVICPANGEVDYNDGEVSCNVHSVDNDDKKSEDEGKGDGGVPFL